MLCDFVVPIIARGMYGGQVKILHMRDEVFSTMNVLSTVAEGEKKKRSQTAFGGWVRCFKPGSQHGNFSDLCKN